MWENRTMNDNIARIYPLTRKRRSRRRTEVEEGGVLGIVGVVLGCCQVLLSVVQYAWFECWLNGMFGIFPKGKE